MKRHCAGDNCPNCGTFMSGGIEHSPFLPDGGVKYVACKRCGYEELQ